MFVFLLKKSITDSKFAAKLVLPVKSSCFYFIPAISIRLSCVRTSNLEGTFLLN